MPSTINYFSLEKNIRTGLLNETVYLFFGTEFFLIQQAVDLLADHFLGPGNRDFNFLRLDARDTDAGQLADELNALPFFGGFRVLVIENADSLFASGAANSGKRRSLSAI